MGNSGSRGGGGSGSKGNSICSIDRRDIRSITHDYSSDKSKTGTICITSGKGVTDCFSTHYRESYPSGHSNSRGGEGRGGGSGSSGTNHGSSSQSTYSSGDNYIVQELTINPYKWQNFSYIEFSSQQLGDDSCRVLNEAFRDARLPNLLTLVLSNNQICDSGGQYLAYSLIHHYNNNLTTLILANNSLTNNGVIPFANGFNQFNATTFPNGAISGGQITKLKTLDLRDNAKVCFSGMLYFFKDIDKCKTKDTSIIFDKFTINTGDIYFLGLNNKLLNDGHILWITGAFNLKWLASIHNLNLGNNQIGDDGAKLLADSLVKGEMPNLKKLQLEGNNITDEGEDALVNALKNETVQDVIITTMTLFEKYQLNINGSDDRKMSIYENRLEQAKARGVDVDNVVVNKIFGNWLANKKDFYLDIVGGWAKCMITYDDVQSFAGEKLIAKVSKRANIWHDLKDAVLCYFEAEKEVLQTEVGVKETKYEMLDVITSPELTGDIEALYDTLYH